MKKKKVPPTWQKPKAKFKPIEEEIFPKTKGKMFRAKIIENKVYGKKSEKQVSQYIIKIPRKLVGILDIRGGDYAQFMLPEELKTTKEGVLIEVMIMRGKD